MEDDLVVFRGETKRIYPRPLGGPAGVSIAPGRVWRTYDKEVRYRPKGHPCKRQYDHDLQPLSDGSLVD